uniref:Uncharacterized protein n=1 Tax=Anguilla anguilla TaxID=7936 RepID=A0A0E9Q021_ANGAN
MLLFALREGGTFSTSCLPVNAKDNVRCVMLIFGQNHYLTSNR